MLKHSDPITTPEGVEVGFKKVIVTPAPDQPYLVNICSKVT